MKNLLVVLTLIISSSAFAKVTAIEEKKFVDFFTARDQVIPSVDCNRKTCAEISIEKLGYVSSDCSKIKNDAQDICAAASIEKSGYVYSDCLQLSSGGLCAEASIKKSGYVYSNCLQISSYRADRCAKASIEKSSYVYSDCLKL